MVLYKKKTIPLVNIHEFTQSYILLTRIREAEPGAGFQHSNPYVCPGSVTDTFWICGEDVGDGEDVTQEPTW